MLSEYGKSKIINETLLVCEDGRVFQATVSANADGYAITGTGINGVVVGAEIPSMIRLSHRQVVTSEETVTIQYWT